MLYMSWLGVFLYKDYSCLRKKRQLPICVSVSPLCICISVCISLAFATVFFFHFCLYFFGVMFVFFNTFALGHISGEGGKGSRAPKSWSQPVGGQLPSRQHLSLVFGLLVNSRQRLCSPFIGICCACEKL